MTPPDYSYFDEAYYQDGAQRGTAYRNYLQNAMEIPFFREMAEKVATIFKPQTALEIGCATGVAVRHLNALGVQAQGIDPSEWAVRNRAHDNVKLGQAENLPFPDKSFDVVYSSGSLEHIPTAVRDKALSEFDRVCRGYQFHMLPIVGEGPYRGDRQSVIEGLSQDKTHYNLLERSEWIELFSRAGWKDTGLQAVFAHDSIQFENSWCNLILGREAHSPGIVRAVCRTNVAAAEKLYRSAQNVVGKAYVMSKDETDILAPQSPALLFSGQWNDIAADFSSSLDLSDSVFRAHVIVSSAAPVSLRWAFLSGGEEHVLEHWRMFEPGLTLMHFRRDQLCVLRGSPDLSEVSRVVFGGTPTAAAVRMAIVAIRGDSQRLLLSTGL
jgi:SAM-dependent methyltransferase